MCEALGKTILFFVALCTGEADAHHLRDPNGIRTRVNAVKGRRPRPLNDGAEAATN